MYILEKEFRLTAGSQFLFSIFYNTAPSRRSVAIFAHMSKKCPKCLEIFDDYHGFCSNCGSRLVDYFEEIEKDPVLNLGDANAISGGISINRSKNITTHDTHYHSTTVHERAKSEMEMKLEATNQLRSKVEEIIAQRGRIDSVAMGQLRPLASQLGIDDDTFKSIIKEVRTNQNNGVSGLSSANTHYLQQALQAVQTNDKESLSNLLPRLESMAVISNDDNVQYIYYLTLSAFNTNKCIQAYEHQMEENYWRLFWAIISYIKTGKYMEATKVLALFNPQRFDKSDEDQNILETYFNIMKGDNACAQDFLNEIFDEPSAQIKPLLCAIETKLYEESHNSLEVKFYLENIFAEAGEKSAKKDVLQNINAKEKNADTNSNKPDSKTDSSNVDKSNNDGDTATNESGIVIKEVNVGTDGSSKLRIKCIWDAHNMNNTKLKLRLHLTALTGDRLKFKYWDVEEEYSITSDNAHINEYITIKKYGLNIEHDENKKIEFYIEFYKWGTDELLYTSKKMNFVIWNYYNFFSKDRFEVKSQDCKP